jgi:virginiamycin A acetyltransferase
MSAPDPTRLYPNLYNPHSAIPMDFQRVVFLRPLIQHPLTSVGEYTYYDDRLDPTGFERNNVLYHYGPERLSIGKFCCIAAGVRFVMAAAAHPLDGVSTYPFPLISEEWAGDFDLFRNRARRSDTVVGNDVWMGHEALVLPGVHIGDGAVIGARSVVVADVPPYAVVGGNPARVLRQRYADADVERLLRVAWWDWPIELVSRHIRTLMSGTVDDIAAVAAERSSSVVV